jgi:hypothetical protein
MSHELSPSTSFPAGITYNAHGERIDPQQSETSVNEYQIPHIRAVRESGNAALNASAVPLGPGFLKAVIDRVEQNQPQISRIVEQKNSEHDPEQLRRYIFPKLEDFGASSISTNRADPSHRLMVSEESSAEATRRYEVLRDENIRSIIKQFAGADIKPEQVQVVLRENDELRIALGLYLRQKLDKSPRMLGHEKSQLSRDAIKNTMPGYDIMPSRDYSVVLALSMLDGTFKYEDILKAEFTEIAKNGMHEEGEHRSGAHRLLNFGAIVSDGKD